MALQYNPTIVTDGLVLHIDPSSNKCFPTFDLPVKSGLILWLDAADDSTFSYSDYTASLVSQWRDKSGLNNHASTSTNKPRRNSQLFSRPSLNFSSSNAVSMSIQSGIILPGDASIFIVHKPGVQDNQYAILIDNFHGTGGNYGFVIQRNSTNSEFYYSSANGSTFLDTGASGWSYTNNTPQILSLNKNSSTGTPYNNGTSLTNRTLHATISQYTTALSIGSWGGYSGRFYNGDMCEILIFNRSLSSNEMKQVHTYLGQKWGIANSDKSIVELTERANAATLTPDAIMNQNIQKSIQFTDNQGSGSYLTFGSLNLNLSSVTIDYWFKLTSDPNVDGNNTYRLMMVKDNNFFNYMEEARVINFTVFKGGTGYRRIGNYNGNVGIFGNGLVEGSDYGSPFNLDTWYNTTFIYNGALGYGYYYLNGTLINSGPMRDASSPYTAITPGNIDNSTSNTYFSTGYSGGLPYFFTGRLASLKVYNRALNSTEVLQNYQAAQSKYQNDIVDYGLVLNLDAGNPYSYSKTGSIWYSAAQYNYMSASLIGGPTYSTNNGGYFIFDGINDYASINNTKALRPSSELTVELVMKAITTTAGWNQIFGINPYTSGGPLIFLETGGTLIRALNYVNSVEYRCNTSETISTSVFKHIVFTFKAGDAIRSYFNGTASTTAALPAGTFTYSTNPYLLAYAGVNWPNVQIGLLRFYDRQLSQTEITKNYNAIKDRFGI